MKGFSLIEVIIALALVLVTLLIFGVAVSSLPLARGARDQNIAYHIAGKKLEDLRHTAFAQLPPSGSFSDPALANLPSGADANLTVANYQSSSSIKQATVVVSWTENGTAESVTMDTLIASGGISQ